MQKKCKNCGNIFETESNIRVFCSTRCKNYFGTFHRKYGQKAICLICQKEFVTSKGFVKVCSQECLTRNLAKNGSINAKKRKDETKTEDTDFSLCGFCKTRITFGKKYCSDECRQNNIDRRKRNNPHVKTDLDGFCKSIPAGMSYGQYVASL